VEGKGHGFLARVVRVVLVVEAHGSCGGVESREAFVGECDAMGVAREVGEDLLGSGEGAFGINDPRLADGLAEEGSEVARFAQGLEFSVEAQASHFEEVIESGNKLSSKDRGEGLDGEEMARMGMLPACFVEGEAAAGDDAVEVVMVHERLAPGVEDSRDADLCGEVVAAELQQGLACGIKEELQKRNRVLAHERVERVGQGEDDVEVGDGKKGGLLALEPPVAGGALAGGAMAVATGMGREVFLAAMRAAIEMAAEFGTAAAEDGAQRLPLVGGSRSTSARERPARGRDGSSPAPPWRERDMDRWLAV